MLAFRTVTYCTENEETPGRSSKPDATFHPARWAARAEKRIFHDPPRLPRNRRPLTATGIWLLKVSSGCELSFMMCIPSGSLLPVAALRIRAQPAQVRALEVETEYVRRRPSDFKQLLPGEPERFISWGSKPEPPKIPSADQRGLSRARSMG